MMITVQVHVLVDHRNTGILFVFEMKHETRATSDAEDVNKKDAVPFVYTKTSNKIKIGSNKSACSHLFIFVEKRIHVCLHTDSEEYWSLLRQSYC